MALRVAPSSRLLYATRLSAAGVGLGTALALPLARTVTALLFDTEPNDPLTFAIVAGLMAAVALGSSYAPGYRATRVDPLVALRSE